MAAVRFTEGHTGRPTPIPSGGQLIPNIIDGMSAARPEALYARIPRSFTSYSAGYRDVTYSQFAGAINGIAWTLREQLGAEADASTIAYFGPNDISYVAVILGAAKAGHAILCPSPRLIPEHVDHLLDINHCRIVLTLQEPHAPVVQSLLSNPDRPIRLLHVPTIYDLLDGNHDHFPYPYTYDAIKDQALVTVHSSGTTGVPKNVTYTHAVASAWLDQMLAPPPEGCMNAASLTHGNTVFTAFPFFHSGGLMISLIWAASVSTTLVLPLAGVPPSSDAIIEGLKLSRADTLLVPTPFLEQIVRNPSDLASLIGNVKTLAFSGADLSDAAAAALSTVPIRVTNYFASTEAMMHPTVHELGDFIGNFPPSDEDVTLLKYLRPHPRLNARFDRRSDDGLHELVWVRNKPSELQPIFLLQPDLPEFRTNDLFRAHPSKPNMWRFDGRSDDLIASATGELCNPVGFEQRTISIPGVVGALVVGAGRWRKGLLIELAAAESRGGAADIFVDSIWPRIDAASESLLTVGSRIARSRVVITDPAKPMLRAGKGTVQRAPTLKLYAAEIDQMYRASGDEEYSGTNPIPVHLSFDRTRYRTK